MTFGYCVVLPRVLPLKYQDIVVKYAAEYNLDKSMVNGVIFCESHFEADAVSAADAVGLMQVTQEASRLSSIIIAITITEFAKVTR